jgi:hypothetical protein
MEEVQMLAELLLMLSPSATQLLPGLQLLLLCLLLLLAVLLFPLLELQMLCSLWGGGGRAEKGWRNRSTY